MVDARRLRRRVGFSNALFPSRRQAKRGSKGAESSARRVQPTWPPTTAIRTRLACSGRFRLPACSYRVAFGPRAGQRVLTVQGAMPREKEFKQTPCADIDGFSLHAAVRCGADDRQALEQLCRYITRPALANERVQTDAAGQVVLKLKTAWRDGTTHLVMSPLGLMQRLAALVPRPRHHGQQTSAAIQRQVRALRARCSTVVLLCSGCSREGRRAFEKPIHRQSSVSRVIRPE